MASRPLRSGPRETEPSRSKDLPPPTLPTFLPFSRMFRSRSSRGRSWESAVGLVRFSSLGLFLTPDDESQDPASRRWDSPSSASSSLQLAESSSTGSTSTLSAYPTSDLVSRSSLRSASFLLILKESFLIAFTLRSALFAGSLRFNLDPFEAYEDADIWDALRRLQMASPTSPKPTPGPSRAASLRREAGEDEEGSETTATEESERYIIKSLEHVVQEGGKNFSAGSCFPFRRWRELADGCFFAGQRQLLALARGILKLRSSSILILDESTASLGAPVSIALAPSVADDPLLPDQATDERIQRTIREEMSDATILCIAHRLRTIIDMDKARSLSPLRPPS